MALAHHIRGKIMLIEKLEVEATTTMSNENEVFMLLLSDKVEGVFEIIEGVSVDNSILFMPNLTPINNLDIC